MRKIEKVVENLKEIAKEDIPPSEKYEKMKKYMQTVKKDVDFYGESAGGGEVLIYQIGVDGSSLTLTNDLGAGKYEVFYFLGFSPESKIIWEN